MEHYGGILRELQASRRLSSELAIERHHQEMEKAKIEKELESLRRSRRQYIDGQIAQSRLEYEQKLLEDVEVSQEHLNRKKRNGEEKAKMAQLDFERERERLIEERNNHDELDKQFRVIDKKLTDLQARSRISEEDENRRLFELKSRKTTVAKLIEQSKKRELFHLEQSKRLALA